MRYVLMGFSAWPLATSLAKALAENTCRYTMERPPLLHRQLMSVFVSAGLISAPGTPCTPLQFETLCYQRCTHTRTPFFRGSLFKLTRNANSRRRVCARSFGLRPLKRKFSCSFNAF